MEQRELCDKCGDVVRPENDATALDRIIDKTSLGLIFVQPRHLLPTDTCPGSPSRAQYLEGQPRDTRPEYAYDERMEPIVRAAYQKLLDDLFPM